MLPNLKTKAVTFVTALAIVAGAAMPAHAWGQREQDTLKGAVGALVLKAIIDDARRDKARVYTPAPVYAPPPVYHQPPAYRPAPMPQPRHYHPRTPAPTIYSTPVARAFNSYSASQRYMIQRRLAIWGYYRGGIDGSFGPGTYSAVIAYARDQGLAGSLRSTAGAFGVYDGLIF